MRPSEIKGDKNHRLQYKMRNWTTLFFLMVTLTSFGQVNFDRSRISKDTDKIVRDIAEVNMVMSSTVGAAGSRPAQYDNFTALKAKATKGELTELTNHPNPTVRCYAFWALSYDHSADLFPLVLTHIKDTAFVETQ